jgi:crotonobetainyl-CoA:carnitine CoA-transferase CaiB-like acyl-CoA transferase
MSQPAQHAADSQAASPSSGPLAGLRVLDIATVLAGPFVATTLGDFGADVIKIELPGRGDTLRTLGPVQGDTSYWWAVDARNKRGITLDLRKPAGKELLLGLIALSDVLVENFVPGTLESWDLAPERLQAANPRLVIVRVSGFGQTGPYRGRPGYDRIGAAFGGLWHLTGRPNEEPMRPGLSVIDYLTGAFSTVGALLALYVRDALGSGKGQIIDSALFESALRAQEFTAVHYSKTGTVRDRVGNGGPAVPSGAFRTRDDRWVMLIVGEYRMFQRLMRAVERDDLADDRRFHANSARSIHQAELNGAIREWIACHDLSLVMDRLQAADIPMSASYTIADLFDDPHVAARGDLVEVDDPELGRVRMQGIVPKLSDTPGNVHRPAPMLGQHNDEIYTGLLGLDTTQQQRLHDEGVI